MVSQEWQSVCTDAILQGERICQVPFEVDGSYVCGPCANSCLAMEQKRPRLTQNFFLPFQCQCSLLCMRSGKKCGYTQLRETQPQMAAKFDSMKEELKVGMQEQIKNTGPDVKEDYAK